jgi:dihydroneopterin aldolase
MEPDQNLSIYLSGLRFFGQFGLYEVESKWNTELILDLCIQLRIPANNNIQLKDTIDYQTAYQVLDSVMKEKHELLESAAGMIIKKIKSMDQRIEYCKISITKKPSLGGPIEGVTISLESGQQIADPN